MSSGICVLSSRDFFNVANKMHTGIAIKPIGIDDTRNVYTIEVYTHSLVGEKIVKNCQDPKLRMERDCEKFRLEPVVPLCARTREMKARSKKLYVTCGLSLRAPAAQHESQSYPFLSSAIQTEDGGDSVREDFCFCTPSSF